MPILGLVVGIVVAAVAGDRFVRGAVGLAAALRVSPGVVGATVAAFATSSPEMVVAVVSARADDPAIALGDATGSNLVNLGVVLGLTALLAPVVVRRADVRRDLPVALAATGLVALLARDGTLSRSDAGALLVVFLAWIVIVIRQARRDRSAAVATIGAVGVRAVALDVGLGLAGLVVAGQLVVVGAKGVGDLLGWDDFVVGAVLVAIGTSTPELVTSLASMRRGHVEVGVGALLGSNVFNLLAIVGVAGAIAPIPVAWDEVALALGVGALATIAAAPDRSGRLGRGRGALLLALYAGYLVLLLTGS